MFASLCLVLMAHLEATVKKSSYPTSLLTKMGPLSEPPT